LLLVFITPVNKDYHIETCCYTTLTGSHISPIESRAIFDDLEWPWRSFTYCKPFQMRFLVHLCSSWKDFNWHIASRRAVPLRCSWGSC